MKMDTKRNPRIGSKTAAASMIKIGTFSKTYADRKVLDFPGYELQAGNIYAVIGANGSGKTTFASVLAGITEADVRKTVLAPEICCGYMPQKSFAFRMSVRRNVMLNGGDTETTEMLLQRLCLTGLRKAGAKILSGGETARLALARLLAGDYDLLVLDEPCASMDMQSTLAAEELMKEYAEKKNAAVVLVTHSLAQAERMASEILYFEEGKLCDDPEKKETYFRFYGTERTSELKLSREKSDIEP